MDVESMIRTTMAEKASTIAPALAPYESFVRLERKHTRARRIRRTAVALSVVAALGAGGVFALDRPTEKRSSPVQVDQNASTTMEALLDSPLRGSLARDEAWVEQMRERLISDYEDDFSLRPGTKVDTKGVKLLYAGDVAGNARVAVGYIPLQGGESPYPMEVWYTGAVQASVDQMRPSSGQSISGERAAVVSNAASRSAGKGWGLAVAPIGTTVSATLGYELTAKGTIDRGPSVSGKSKTGVLEFDLPADTHQPHLMVSVDSGDDTPETEEVGASWDSGEIDDARYKEVIREALDGRKPGFKVTMLTDCLIEAVDLARTSIDAAEVKIPWVGRLDGEPAVVFTVHEPGQGFLAFAYRIDKVCSSDYQVLMPVEGAADRPIAYRLYAKGKPSSNVNVVAPPNTERLELTVKGQQPQVLDLNGSGNAQTTVAPDDQATVTAYDGAGSEIGSTPLLPFRGRGQIGEDKGTRLVP